MIPQPKTLYIFSQNMSGGRSKIALINDRLTILHYDVVALHVIYDQELIANIPFNVFRRDHSNFLTDATIRDCYIATEIPFTEKTFIEKVAIHIEDATASFDLLNVYVVYYIPPSQNTPEHEFEFAVKKIYESFPTSRILICGDFNAPGLKWAYEDDDQIRIILSNTNTRLSIHERSIMSAFASCGLFQLNHFSNNRGIYLDLILSNDHTNMVVQLAGELQSIDKHTHHHIGFTADLTYLSLPHDTTDVFLSKHYQIE